MNSMKNNDYNLDKEIETGLALAEKMLKKRKTFIVFGAIGGIALLLTIIFALPSLMTPAEPTLTATVTNSKTPMPTATFTATNIPTSIPTATRTPPPTPLPAKIGETVIANGFEFTVEEIIYRDRYQFNSYQFYSPVDGFIFLDIVVRIQNSHPKTSLIIPWNTVLAFEDDGGARTSKPPQWTYIDYVSEGEAMNSDRFPYIEYDSKDIQIEHEHDAYIRAIFVIHDSNKSVLLEIDNSPLVDVTKNK